jgi:ribose 5-phosphate isomerase RpiB
MKPLYFILDRLNENSTWRGILLVATGLGVSLSPQHQEAIVAAGLGLVGAINIFRKGK